MFNYLKFATYQIFGFSCSIPKLNKIKKNPDNFTNKEIYDFSGQLDRLLLFLVYNSVRDILYSSWDSQSQRRKIISKILQEDIVKDMFKRLDISKLCVSKKQKILTFCYAHPIVIPLLFSYFAKRKDR